MYIYPKDFGSDYSDHVGPNGCAEAEHCCSGQAVERLLDTVSKNALLEVRYPRVRPVALHFEVKGRHLSRK